MEIFESITIPLPSLQYEESSLELTIEVRVWYDDHAGLQAEPVSWRLAGDGQESTGERPRMRHDDMWQTVRRIVDAEYTDTILAMIGWEHPAFEQYRADMNIEARMEREWHRRNTL